MKEINKKILYLNILVSQGILFLAGYLWLRFLTPENSWHNILKLPENTFVLCLAFLAGSALLLSLQFIFLKYVERDLLTDELNLVLISKFSLAELFVIFFTGALVEEILFRGIIQTHLGIWLASFLFTIIHFRYLQKIVLIMEVYLMGLILGAMYLLTQTIWVPIFCHLTVNIITAFMIKKGIIQFEVADGQESGVK